MITYELKLSVSVPDAIDETGDDAAELFFAEIDFPLIVNKPTVALLTVIPIPPTKLLADEAIAIKDALSKAGLDPATAKQLSDAIDRVIK
jgi:hypothetical protein